ncbi:hypothetical protein EI012_24545 [Escherichia coli]|nr:hypothetical protein [Escherichia coli]MQL41130.1 hypothetical protein [Escherichia coli]
MKSGYTVKPPTGDSNEQTQFIDYFNLFYSKRGQEQISISQQLGNYGTTFFSASRQSYWNRGLTLSGTKTHVKQRFLPLTPLLMVSDVLWSPVLPA